MVERFLRLATAPTPPEGRAKRSYAFVDSPARFYGVMGVLLLVEILGSLESSMITTAIPTIVREFKDVQAVGWLITAFGLTTAATAAIGGRLGDIFGRRRLLIVVVLLGAIGSLISAFAPNLPIMILGRAFQGTAGVILPLCYGITRELAAPGRAPFWIGILTGGYAFSAAGGYILGGILSDAGSWRSIFVCTAAVALVTVPLLLLFVPPMKGVKTSAKLDVLGGVLFAPAIASILLGVTQGSKWGWDSAAVWSLIGGGVAVLAFWGWYEARRQDPLIDVRLLRHKEIAVGNICTALAAFGSLQHGLLIFMILQQPVLAGVGLGVTATMAAVLKLPSNISSVAGGPMAGWLAGKYGASVTVALGGLVGLSSWGALVFFHESVLQVVLLSVTCGIGNMLLLVGLPNMVLQKAPHDRSSEVTGLAAVVRGLFSAIGAQTMTFLLSTSLILEPVSGAKLPSEGAYQLAFGAVATACALIVLLSFATRHRPRFVAAD